MSRETATAPGAGSDPGTVNNTAAVLTSDPQYSIPPPNVQAIPPELKARPQWVAWHTEERDGKPTKVPYSPRTGYKAKSDTPKTWATFEAALSAYQDGRGYDGIGYVFSGAEDDFVGIDLDKCADGDGNLELWAADIVAALSSYTERSPGGRGLHIIIKGKLPEGGRRKGKVEMYDFGRYFTMTGNLLSGARSTIENRQAELEALHARIFGAGDPRPKPCQTSPRGTLDDAALLQKAMSAANGAKFARLWVGDWTGYESESEADLALCGMLAFWTGSDKTQIDRLFRQSSLYRPKWDEVHYADGRTYGQGTIEETLSGKTEFYSPDGRLTPTTTIESNELDPAPDPLPDCPLLPEEARLDPALGEGAGGWLYWYTGHATAISPMTPLTFHLSAGLWLASVAIARRLVLPLHFGSVYPNLFVAWIATTTLYRKSTALDVARGIARRVFPFLQAAQDTTPEAFLSDLAGREPAYLDKLTEGDREEWQKGRDHAAQRGWVLDEMSGLLAAAGRNYNAGLVEALLRFYDCSPWYTRSTRGQGRVTVRNSYLAMLGASTPAAMSVHLNSERLWAMGFWPRFAILTPEASPDWERAREHNEPPQVVGKLRQLYEWLPVTKWPNPPEALTVSLAGGVYDAWERYNKALSYDLLRTDEIDPRLHGTYGRLPVQALKVAMILAALDWSEPPSGPKTKTPTIDPAHLARALSISEEWRASAHRALELATANEFDRVRVRILRQIGRFMPNGATVRDLYRNLGKEPVEVELVLSQMVELGEVEVVEVKPGRKGGRRTKRYRLVTE